MFKEVNSIEKIKLPINNLVENTKFKKEAISTDLRSKIIKFFVKGLGLPNLANPIMGDGLLERYIYKMAWNRFFPIEFIYVRLNAIPIRERKKILSRLEDWESRGILEFSSDRSSIKTSELLRKRELTKL